MFELPQLSQLTLTQEIGIIAFFIIAAIIISRLLKKEDREFERVYSDILNSDKYKVKGRFEE